MRPLTIVLEKDPSTEKMMIAHFEGDFDGAARDNLEVLQKEIEAFPVGGSMIFDFSNLNYLNSFALSQMVTWHKALDSKGGKMAIVGTNDHIKDIFMVLGVDGIFKTYDTLEEAKLGLI